MKEMKLQLEIRLPTIICNELQNQTIQQVPPPPYSPADKSGLRVETTHITNILFNFFYAFFVKY